MNKKKVETRWAVFDSQFAVQNSEAHRQMPQPINAPALTWHNGFWKPDKLSSLQWHKNVDAILFHIYEAATDLIVDKEKVETPNKDAENALSLFRHRIKADGKGKLGRLKGYRRTLVRFHLPFNSLSLTILAEMSREFWTITYIIETHIPDHYYQIKNSEAPIPELAAIKDKFSLFISKLSTGETIGTVVPDKASNTCENSTVIDSVENKSIVPDGLPTTAFRDFIQEFVHDKAMDRFYEVRTANKVNAGSAHICRGALNSSDPAPWGAKFLDFRGVVIPCRDDAPITSPSSSDGGNGNHRASPVENDVADYLQNGIADGDATSTVLPVEWNLSEKWRVAGDSLNDACAAEGPSVEQWLSLVKKAWPIVDRMHRKEPSPEISVSTFHGGNSLYVSSLGRPHASERRHMLDSLPGNSSSVKYLVLAAHRSKWEVGRLVDRLHRAGTMRVAAMRDLAGIERADKMLDRFWRDVAEARNALRNNRLENNRSEELRNTVIEQQKRLEAIYDMKQIPGGLEFRVSRAQYYIQQFATHAKALRIGRIPGFQRYDEFVKRRLSAAFESISSTFVRYKEARNELDLLLQGVQAEMTIKLTRDAEALIGIGAVYYLGHVLGKLIVLAYEGDHWEIEDMTYAGLLALFAVWLAMRRISLITSRNKYR